MIERPLILVTNDDGLDSPGLVAAAAAVGDIGDLLIVAPLCQQTGMSRAFPSFPDAGRIERRALVIGGRSVEAFGVSGSPAMAVSHAALELANRPIRMCLSGINYGENLGFSLGRSGTVGAAFEACAHGIPGVAASLEAGVDELHSSVFRAMDWAAATHFTRLVCRAVLAHGLPGDVAVLNLNIPQGATPRTSIRTTRQSRQNYYRRVRPGRRPLGEPLRLETALDLDEPSLEPDSDIWAIVRDRVVSVTPLSWSMTATTPWQPTECDDSSAP